MENVGGIVQPALAGMGYELVDLQLCHRGRLLRIFIDRVAGGGVTVDDCAAVSQHLTHLFAVERVEYERLEVSSPGLDRPLRGERDFARFAGRRVSVRLRAPDDSGRRRFTGLLRGAQDGIATFEVEGRTLALRLEAIERARLVPQW